MRGSRKDVIKTPPGYKVEITGNEQNNSRFNEDSDVEGNYVANVINCHDEAILSQHFMESPESFLK